MRSEKRRDWYDEIYDTYVSMHLRGDEANIVEWTPFGRNSIDITFRVVVCSDTTISEIQ